MLYNYTHQILWNDKPIIEMQSEIGKLPLPNQRRG